MKADPSTMKPDPSNISEGKKRVLHAIFKHCDREEDNGVSMAEVADICDISRTVASKHCRKLKKYGLIHDLRGWEQRTSYVVDENVSIDMSYNWEQMVTQGTMIQMISAFVALGVVLLHINNSLYGPTIFDMYVVIVISVLPSFLYDVYTHLHENELNSISVSVSEQ